MGYSVYCDWSEEFKNPDKWENNSYRVLETSLEDKRNPNFKNIAERLGVLDDKGDIIKYYEENIREYTTPIYNYIYPLSHEPSDEDILRVSLNTNCCVLLNTENDTFYLSLTGCGMDLSQDIALSYLFLNELIPFDLLKEVSSQEGLSISMENFKELKKAVLEQAEIYKNSLERIKTEWNN